jgi:hypothetical protein
MFSHSHATPHLKNAPGKANPLERLGKHQKPDLTETPTATKQNDLCPQMKSNYGTMEICH